MSQLSNKGSTHSKSSTFLRTMHEKKLMEKILGEQAEQKIDDLEVEIKDPVNCENEDIEELKDEVEELIYDPDDKLTSVSQLKPTSTNLSKMSGRTYISML